MSVWQTLPLSDVLADAKPGFACGEDPPDGVFQFRMNNVTTEGQINLSKKRRVPREMQNLDKFLVEPGDVLFNATNSPELVGKSAFFPGYNEAAVFSNHFLRLRPRTERLDGRFLARWLTLQFQRRVFQNMCRQWVNQATVGRESLLALRIPLPPLPEQRRIAEMLDRAEALRAKRRAALAQLDTLAQAIFLDMFGDPATNPKGFPKVELGEIVKVIGGYAFKSEDFATKGKAVVRISNLTGDGIDLLDIARIPESKLGKGASFKIYPGEILIAMSGATTGKLGIVPLNIGEDLYQNQRVGNYRITDPKKIQQGFLLGLLRTDFYQRFLWQLAWGAAQPNVSGGQLQSAVVALPPLSLQNEFARRIAAVEKLKTAHSASLAELDALFAALQHRAFRGEL